MTVALTGLGRVFVNSSGRQGGNRYKYHACMKVDGVDKSLGDVTSIFCPKPDAYDEFIEIGTIKGADSRATSTLTGYLPIDSRGILEEIFNQRCGFDLQIHYGQCNRPDDFNQFLSAMILKDVKLTSYAISALTARTPDERAAVDETAAISIGDFYRIYSTTEAKLQPTQLTGNVNAFGIDIASVKSCGDNCNERDDGCEVWIGGHVATNKSLSFIITEDGGSTWRTTSMRTTLLHTAPEHLALLHISDGYVYVLVSQNFTSYVLRASITSILNGFADTTLIYTSPVSTYFHQMTSSDNYVWIAGVQQPSTVYVIAISKDTLIATPYTKVDTEGYMRAIYAYSDDSILTMGDNSNGYYTTIRGGLTKITTKPIANVSISAVKMFSQGKWVVGGADGIYYTNNYGVTWTKVLTTSGIMKFSFYDDIVGYAVTQAGTYRTLDSGNSWLQIGSTVTNHVYQVTVCPSNPNEYLAAVGLIGTSYFLKGTN